MQTAYWGFLFSMLTSEAWPAIAREESSGKSMPHFNDLAAEMIKPLPMTQYYLIY